MYYMCVFLGVEDVAAEGGGGGGGVVELIYDGVGGRVSTPLLFCFCSASSDGSFFFFFFPETS